MRPYKRALPDDILQILNEDYPCKTCAFYTHCAESLTSCLSFNAYAKGDKRWEAMARVPDKRNYGYLFGGKRDAA